MSWHLDPALPILADMDEATRAELVSACEEHVARPLRDPVPGSGRVATFGLIGAACGPSHVLLCEEHAREWSWHMTGCAECRGLAWLNVEPLDRKRTRG